MIIAGTAAALAISCAELLRPELAPLPDFSKVPLQDGALLAQTTWRLLIDDEFHGSVWLYLAMKIPSWLALCGVLISAAIVSYSNASQQNDWLPKELSSTRPNAGSPEAMRSLG
jgi:hypothetical protein